MIRRWFLMSAVAASLAPSAWAAPDAVALIKEARGDVRVVRESGTSPATTGQALQAGDRVVTGEDAVASIVFHDGTRLTLGAAADVRVRDYVFEPRNAQYGLSLYLAKGSAIYSSGKIGKLAPQKVSVQTPTATVGVRGTRFIVEADPAAR